MLEQTLLIRIRLVAKVITVLYSRMSCQMSGFSSNNFRCVSHNLIAANHG
jgi:hypothetical protein